MLFNSEFFLLIFFPIVVLLFFCFQRWRPGAPQIWCLILASLVFYGSWNPPLLTLLVGSIVGNYLVARQLQYTENKVWLIFGISANLGVLAYFKYANFFSDILRTSGLFDFPLFEIILPLGISFFTFQQIAFLCDTHARKVTHIDFHHYALFICFFPQLIAGPIVHHADVVDQFRGIGRDPIDPKLPAAGITLILIGLFKKSVIAADLADVADPLFQRLSFGETLGFFEGWLAALSFGLQIYFDFSAYSDMAIGIAMVFGILLPINFFAPYQAVSIIDFWRRWHITLSTFLRDYLYISLGGNRKGKIARYRNLIIVMLLGGLWHGAGWTFVLWGGLHGVALALAHFWRSCVKGTPLQGLIGNWTGWILTMVIVFLAWVPFRADTFSDSLSIWSSMLAFQSLGGLPRLDDWLPVLLGAAICLLLPPLAHQFRSQLTPPNKTLPHPQDGGISIPVVERRLNWSPTSPWALGAGALGFIGVLQLWQTSSFIYFQF